MTDETTQLGTIWSQTLMDVLCAAVRKNNESDIRGVLQEMKQKRYSRDQVRKYAAKNLEPGELAVLDRIMKSSSA